MRNLQADPKPQGRRRDPDLMRLLHLDPGPCCVCGASAPEMHLHHIIPRARGGDDSRENLCWVCRQCHFDIHAHRLSAVQLASIVPVCYRLDSE